MSRPHGSGASRDGKWVRAGSGSADLCRRMLGRRVAACPTLFSSRCRRHRRDTNAFSEAALSCQEPRRSLPFVSRSSLVASVLSGPLWRGLGEARRSRMPYDRRYGPRTTVTPTPRHPYPRVNSYELATRMPAPRCEPNRWGLRRFAVSSARFLHPSLRARVWRAWLAGAV